MNKLIKVIGRAYIYKIEYWGRDAKIKEGYQIWKVDLKFIKYTDTLEQAKKYVAEKFTENKELKKNEYTIIQVEGLLGFVFYDIYKGRKLITSYQELKEAKEYVGEKIKNDRKKESKNLPNQSNNSIQTD